MKDVFELQPIAAQPKTALKDNFASVVSASSPVLTPMVVREEKDARTTCAPRFATPTPTVRLERFVSKELVILDVDRTRIVKLRKSVSPTSADVEQDTRMVQLDAEM